MTPDTAEAGSFESGRAAPAGPGYIRFSDEITIMSDQPRLAFAKSGVPVYAAEGEGRASRNLLAYLCDPALSPRSLKASDYASLSNPNLMRLISAGPVLWEPEHRRRYAFLYEMPAGQRLSEQMTPSAPLLRSDIMLQSVLKPMIGVLRDLRSNDIVHGDIHPGNMFGEMKGLALEKFLMGECLCLPPSYGLPSLYETVERAMAQPTAKGIGTYEDDMYSLGVTLAVLIRQNDPMTGFTTEQIVRTKVEVGTYAAVLGKDNISGSPLELLRGLMQDEPAQRWTLDDIESWIDGRRQTPKAGGRKRKAARPLLLNNKKYFHPEIIAYEMFQNPTETTRMIESGEFEQWISRALEDSQTEARMVQLRTAVDEGGLRDTHDKRMASCMSMALHPQAPLRYEGLSLMPQGIGTAITETLYKRGNIKPYLDLIQSRLVVQWLEMQDRDNIDVSAIFSEFENCRNHLNQAQAGFGFERVVYTLDAECACLSDKISRFYARTPEEVLFAFEELIKARDNPLRLFDRHIIAFLIARDRKNVEPFMVDLNSPVESKRLFGELGALASIQKRTRSAPTPNLSQWFAKQQDLFLSRIHDREERSKISAAITASAGQGDLTRLLTVLDNQKMKRADMAQFSQAMREYQAIEKEAGSLQRELHTNPKFGRGTGRSVAAGISAIIATIIILGTVLMTLTRNGGPAGF